VSIEQRRGVDEDRAGDIEARPGPGEMQPEEDSLVLHLEAEQRVSMEFDRQIAPQVRSAHAQLFRHGYPSVRGGVIEDHLQDGDG
jgi:hypothetical protein